MTERQFQLAGTVPDNATLLPGCEKPPLTRVLYSDVIGRPLSPVRAPGVGPPGAACAPTPGGYFLTSAGPISRYLLSSSLFLLERIEQRVP